MAGQPLTVKSQFIPAPLDGLNLIAPPDGYKPTEARTLDNYLVFDTGIRQIPMPAKVYDGTGDIDFQFPFRDTTDTDRVMFSLGNSIYRYNVVAATATDITGGSAITTAEWQPCYFNKHILLFNGVDVPRIHDLGTGNVADTTFSGVTQSNLIQATGYKSRLYIVQASTTSFWYGAVGAFAGALTQFDLAQIFQYPGNLQYVFSWTFNQGLQNEELFVAISSQGEFLVYSGDYPTAPNWQLIAKGRMPAPQNSTVRQPFVKVANDVYIVTTRGAMSLSSLVSGNSQSENYFNLSRNIKLNVVTGRTPVLDNVNPFAYFVGADVAQLTSIYALNYERQAWSRIYSPTGLGMGVIKSLSSFNGILRIGTSNGDIYQLDIADQTNSDTTHTWETPFFNFATNLQKHSKMIRVVGLNYGNSSSFANTVSVSTDFVVPASPTTDTGTTSVAADTNTVQELSPPGTGRWLSYKFNKTGLNSVNQKNELQGFEVFYETGGAY